MRKIITKKQVLKLVPWSSTTHWRRVKAGDFPQPVQISPNLIGWYEDEVETWLESRPRGIAELPENLNTKNRS